MHLFKDNQYFQKEAFAVFGKFKLKVIVGSKFLDYGIVKYYCVAKDGVSGQGLVKERDLIFSDVL